MRERQADYLIFVAVEYSTGKLRNHGNLKMKAKLHDNPKLCFLIQGVKEDPAKSKDENFVPTTENVKEILKLIEVKPKIADIKRLGKLNKYGKNRGPFW